MVRRTTLTLLLVALVAFAGCSALSDGGDSTAVPTANGSDAETAAGTATGSAPTTEAATATATAMATGTTGTTAAVTPTTAGSTATETAAAPSIATTAPPTTGITTSTATATETATPTATATATTTTTATSTETATPTPTATATETATATPTSTPTATETATSTETATETDSAESSGSSDSAAGPDTPLDADSVGEAHENALDTAGSFVVNQSSTRYDPNGDGPESDSSGARVDLDDDIALQVSRPTEEATRYTYAEGSTAYKKNVLSGDAQYETDQLGKALAGSLTGSDQVYETVRAVDYERSGTVTRDGTQFAVYVANGTDSVDTSGAIYHNEDLSAFNSTLMVNPETGVVRSLETARTTDYLSSGAPVTIETSLRFSAVGDTDVDRPGWVDDMGNEN